MTLIQTGKAPLHPIVLLDRPGGEYWTGFDRFVRTELLDRRFVSPDDLSLYRRMDDHTKAVEHIDFFYSTYHSERIVGKKVVFRLNVEPHEKVLQVLSEEFTDILDGPIERTNASQSEVADDDVPDLPRIALRFDRMHNGRLRLLVDRLNELQAELG